MKSFVLYAFGIALVLFGNREMLFKFEKFFTEDQINSLQEGYENKFIEVTLRKKERVGNFTNPYHYFQIIRLLPGEYALKKGKNRTTIEYGSEERASDSV